MTVFSENTVRWIDYSLSVKEKLEHFTKYLIFCSTKKVRDNMWVNKLYFGVNDPFETAPNSAATFMILDTFLWIFLTCI